MTGQTARSLLCRGAWTRRDLVHASDIKKATSQPIIEDDESDYEMERDWDRIRKHRD